MVKDILKKKVAILGFGTVGQGIYEGIITHQKRIESLIGNPVEIVAILVRDGTKKRSVGENVLVTTDIEDILRIQGLEIVFEAIVGREPGYSYLKRLIQKGCHVITANKLMFAHHGNDLLELAGEHEVSVRYEATVAGGVPIIGNITRLLKTNEITEVQGIINGTSNYILTKMHAEGLSFEQALLMAQEIGYAESDPTSDIEGSDAFYKLVILIKTITGMNPDWKKIYCEGISSISMEQVQIAKDLNLHFRHVANYNGRNSNDCWVKPVLIDSMHPFYLVNGVNNSIHIKGSLVGSLILTGPGAGKYPTASAMIEDFVQIFQNSHTSIKNSPEYPKMDSNEYPELKHWFIFSSETSFSPDHPSVSVLSTFNSKGQIAYFVRSDEKTLSVLKERYSFQAYEVLSPNGLKQSIMKRPYSAVK